MTRIFNDPADFAESALAGFVAAFPNYVIRVDGGVVRRAASPKGQVALIIGGGSGHYPAFAGLVGRGLATGAACGNVFAAPSAGQAYRVARAADNGGGILFSYGNYAGDRMQFGQAQQRLLAEGIDARTVVVTDDVASAPRAEVDQRRGIAGGLAVFKVAGAAADAGLSLDEVERVAQKANAQTRTLGVAFDGCTLPGAAAPLFSVPAGHMSIGLGIHGEPGVEDVPMTTASGIAKILVTQLLQEKPGTASERLVVLLNGLGAVKYEEQFVLFADVVNLLTSAGFEIAGAECGELVTSLDMSGLSLTLFWLDEELEELWSAPANSPAYRSGAQPPASERRPGPTGALTVPQETTEESRRVAKLALLALRSVGRAVHAHEGELGQLDAVAGDGDHGMGMCRGADAALGAAQAALEQGAGVRQLLLAAGEEWSERAGGTSGALWGAGLMSLGSSLGDKDAYDAVDLVAGVTLGVEAIAALGGAQPGDKTVLDSLQPFAEALRAEVAAGHAMARAIRVAADEATRAAAATAPLRPRKGRARPLADRSIGTPDPGAVSFALIVNEIANDIVHWPGPESGAGPGAGP